MTSFLPLNKVHALTFVGFNRESAWVSKMRARDFFYCCRKPNLAKNDRACLRVVSCYRYYVHKVALLSQYCQSLSLSRQWGPKIARNFSWSCVLAIICPLCLSCCTVMLGILVVLVLKKISWVNKTKSHNYAKFWKHVHNVYRDANFLRRQPVMDPYLFWQTLINKHKM